MKSVNISELRNKLSAILDKLPALGAVRIVDRNKPIAVIYPLSSAAGSDDDQRLLALERAGLINRQTTPLSGSVLEEAPPSLAKRTDAVKALIEERSGGI